MFGAFEQPGTEPGLVETLSSHLFFSLNGLNGTNTSTEVSSEVLDSSLCFSPISFYEMVSVLFADFIDLLTPTGSNFICSLVLLMKFG